eukprot:4816800-Amphidinium_carterae.1
MTSSWDLFSTYVHFNQTWDLFLRLQVPSHKLRDPNVLHFPKTHVQTWLRIKHLWPPHIILQSQLWRSKKMYSFNRQPVTRHQPLEHTAAALTAYVLPQRQEQP